MSVPSPLSPSPAASIPKTASAIIGASCGTFGPNEASLNLYVFVKLGVINSTLLLSQSKSWVENEKFEEFGKIFSCNNHNDIIGEFLFLISNFLIKKMLTPP